MINYNISINKELAQIVEQKIKEGKYANRSEFFRELIRRLFVMDKTFDISLVTPDNSDYKKLEKMSQEKDKITSYSKFLKNI